MKITDIFKEQEQTFSFEFFPPGNEISAVDFGINLGQLMKLSPSFITVTYGAGGSTQERTFTLVDYIHNSIGITCVAHYTCVNATREKIKKDLDKLYNKGIQNLMLLRGDPPKGQEKFVPTPGGCSHASDLIKYAKEVHDFCTGAACYPEKHPEAQSLEQDLTYLKSKVDSGADFLTTQLFFDNNVYFDFVQQTRKAGIQCRIIPGILPITNYNQMKRITQLSEASMPVTLLDNLETYRDNPDKINQIGIDYAIEQTRDLLARNAPGLHFYTLNQSRAAIELFETLSINFIRKKSSKQYKLNF